MGDTAFDFKAEEEKGRSLTAAKTINFQDKLSVEKPAEKEELKNECTESFANKKKLGLKVNAKKHFLAEPKMDEINSSDKIGNVFKKKSVETAINGHPFRHLIFSPYVTESTFKRHLTITYRGLVYSKKCLKGPSEAYIRAKQVNLVDSKSNKTCVLVYFIYYFIEHLFFISAIFYA